ncbi:MAG: glycosyltransferase family 2 protein [Bacteroidales bacterium]|nr:glycosyltransferase family 2 protein [Bacteroidales bacterium]
MDVSIVIPLLNEEESLPELCDWIDGVLSKSKLTYEVILVDDGSNDGSWAQIEALKGKFPQLRGIKFRRNYGKSAALHTGFGLAEGEVVFTMDADLQDSPEEIPEMRRMIVEEGFDVISGWKKKRYDPFLRKRVPTKLFNWAARKVSGIRLHDFNCGLKAYRLNVVKSVEVYGDMHRYIPVLAKGSGFTRIGEKVVQHQERKYGVTKFGMDRFVKGFLDLLTISFLIRFGKKPMHLFGALGTLMFIVGMGMALYLGIDKLVALIRHIPQRLIADSAFFYIGLTSMILGTLLFIGGFLGELVSRNAVERNRYEVEKEI